MMKNILTAAAIALALSACQSSEIKGETTNTPNPATEQSQPLITNAPAEPTVQSDAIVPVANQEVKQELAKTQTVAPAAKTTANVALNPEHGQPGHRCEIPVGAPLNSTPESQPAIQTQLTPPGKPASTAGNVRLNPPHGEPGHDCAVPVGEPLKN